MCNILIVGGYGQLGQALADACTSSTNRYIRLSHSDVEICDEQSISRAILFYNADIVVNCAAYTDVERAEDDEESAYKINGVGVALLAKVCAKYCVKLIHISTDYVFGEDTQRNVPYTEHDTTAPVNIYGKSKVVGEEAVLSVAGNVVIRTSWLYSPYGKNFCHTILRLCSEQESLHVVNDQYGSPTSALSLSRNIVRIIDDGTIDNMHGIYHITDYGSCTWYDLACKIVEIANKPCKVHPCTSTERQTRAQRPRYSVLKNSRLEPSTEITTTPWQEALQECINEINKSK